MILRARPACIADADATGNQKMSIYMLEDSRSLLKRILGQASKRHYLMSGFCIKSAIRQS